MNKFLYILDVTLFWIAGLSGIGAFGSWTLASLLSARLIELKTYSYSLLYGYYDPWPYLMLGWAFWIAAVLSALIGVALLAWREARKETTRADKLVHLPQQP